ncbi:MAG TPA: archaetidylserine decarboxylase [Steroidobacteraceae bacterium]|nr:archaetidylserine decarboxylase [Steroidobacteraceae bacterium]
MSAAAPPEGRPPSAGGRLFAWLQYLLPQRALSRLVHAAAHATTPWFKNWLARGFLRLYRVDLAEAAEPDPRAYANFNELFTRALKPGARPIAPDPRAVASPVDGTVSECGAIDGGRLLQAKGRYYALADLLAGQAWAERFAGGSFATIYLAPCNYHRVHMPLAARLLDTVFVPGRLFSVNASTAACVPRLFARNERILTLFEAQTGRFALIMVGALNVSSMATVWAGEIAPRERRAVTRLPQTEVRLQKGAELGRFNMGSTVILLFEPNRVRWLPACARRASLRMGAQIGTLL